MKSSHASKSYCVWTHSSRSCRQYKATHLIAMIYRRNANISHTNKNTKSQLALFTILFTILHYLQYWIWYLNENKENVEVTIVEWTETNIVKKQVVKHIWLHTNICLKSISVNCCFLFVLWAVVCAGFHFSVKINVLY